MSSPKQLTTPLPVSVTSVEMIRDGGSFAAEFVGDDGAEYWLFFPIHQVPVAPTRIEKLGHLPPRIFRTRTGSSTADERLLSWEEARKYLEVIRPLISAEDTWSRRYFQRMAAVAERSGELSADDPAQDEVSM